MRREKSNEIAETAICPQEMVAHSGTLETLETLLTDLPKGTFIIYNLEVIGRHRQSCGKYNQSECNLPAED